MNQLPAVFTVLTIASVLTLATSAHAGEDFDRPNIVLIMAEDIGNDLACYGTKGVKTPTLDKLADDGMRYTRFYTNSPICSPSRTALMLGMYQTSCNGHNHRSNVKGASGLHYMTHYLRQAGYVNLVGSKVIQRKSGKTDINVRLDEPLFDKSNPKPGQPFFQQIQLQVTHRQANDSRWQDLRASKKLPVSTREVEIPPYLPDTPEVRLDWATYLDQIEQADLETSQIIADLKEKGQLDRTILIWIGDNGRCQIRGKGYLFEDGIKCPMIIWGKGIEQGKTVNDLVSGIDLTATILALAGIEKPAQMQGQAFLANPGYESKQYVFCARDRWDEIVDCSRVIVGERYKYIHNFMPEVPYDAGQKYLDTDNVRPILPLLRQMNRSRKLNAAQAYFFRPEKEVEQLYDLQQDPWELHNLAASAGHNRTKAELREKLFQWFVSTNDQGLTRDNQGTWKPKLEMQMQTPR
ncbi:sulfatase family protein [Novipirellula artificiosorum]|uniref:Arylsulfatase n=1 Tax=Novipirellula artificiosorum TaxID=2528016 RepID=A0A5C6DBV0_9BACT|nr:sulfatase [Novipirellula artificiosorum]TWU33267.1 Arylsulfatase [Novipirellula artificiosorum]